MAILIITHVRIDGSERDAKNITEVWCETSDVVPVLDQTTLLPRALSVAHLVAEIRKGTKVYADREALDEVEAYEDAGRHHIRSKRGANDHLLSLPEF